jgi:hypothetical protein
MSSVVVDVLLSLIPLLLVCFATQAWRITRPRWKFVAKLVLHPCAYALLSLWIGHAVIALAWVHQGLLGLGSHLLFCKKHGFTWYAVEDPERYASLSAAALRDVVTRRGK